MPTQEFYERKVDRMREEIYEGNAEIGKRDKRIAELEAALRLITDGGTVGRSQSPALNMPDEDWLRYRISDLESIARKALGE